MCGICGQYNFGSKAPVLRQDVERMTRSIIHRGPDDEGYYIAGPLGFGFRSVDRFCEGTRARQEDDITIVIIDLQRRATT